MDILAKEEGKVIRVGLFLLFEGFILLLFVRSVTEERIHLPPLPGIYPHLKLNHNKILSLLNNLKSITIVCDIISFRLCLCSMVI